jgi:hypothetical protein
MHGAQAGMPRSGHGFVDVVLQQAVDLAQQETQGSVVLGMRGSLVIGRWGAGHAGMLTQRQDVCLIKADNLSYRNVTVTEP